MLLDSGEPTRTNGRDSDLISLRLGAYATRQSKTPERHRDREAVNDTYNAPSPTLPSEREFLRNRLRHKYRPYSKGWTQ